MLDNTLTLNELLKREDLLRLSLSEWKKLLEDLYGNCQFTWLIQVLYALILNQDKSTNSFYYKDKAYWLDKNTRIGLQNLINSGAEDITLQLNTTTYIDISASKLREFLNKLEVYAGKCFATTAKHLQNMRTLYSLDDIVNYDFTSGYPIKLTLNEN